VFVVAFALLAVAEFELWFELLYVAVLALFWTIAGAQRNAAGVTRARRQHGLPEVRPTGRRRRLRWARRVATFVLWVGFLGTACFIGGLLAAPFR
jgi:hypothetical protein